MFIIMVKYVLIVLCVDNYYEGGIFVLYVLVCYWVKWLIFVVLIGGVVLLVDGILIFVVIVILVVEGLKGLFKLGVFF